MARRRANEAAAQLSPVYMNLPALWDDHINQSGYYVAATLEDDLHKNWKGYALYESFTLDSGYNNVGRFSRRAVICRVVTPPLGADTVDYRLMDRASVMVIETLNSSDELASVSEEEMLAGKNRFLVGNEIIGAATIKQTAYDSYTKVRTYELTVLNRGLKDTFVNMEHFEGENCVWLDGPGIYFQHKTQGQVGVTVYLKAISGGGTVSEGIPSTFTFAGETLKPFRPINIAGRRNVSNDVIVTWTHQTRSTVQLMQQGSPSHEEITRYKIRVLSSPGASISLRETIIEANNDSLRTWTYTASQQTSDGLTPGDPVDLEMLQMSSLVQDTGNFSAVTV